MSEVAIYEESLEHRGDISFFLKEGEETLGFVNGFIKGQVVSLDGLHVSLVHRRKRFGSILVEKFLKWAIDNGATKLRGGKFNPEFGSCEGPKKFYDKHGIEIDENDELYKDF